MAEGQGLSSKEWFTNCGGWRPRHDTNILRAGIQSGRLDEQDQYGMTALSLAVSSGWALGIDELLRAGADTELRDHRTGETALRIAVDRKIEWCILRLLAAGANPDAGNHWGLTPRAWLRHSGFPTLFDGIPVAEPQMPPPRIQNAEHLAENHYPDFKIPERAERESMEVGQAVDLYVYGPKSEAKQDRVKVRITSRTGHGPWVQYAAILDMPIERTHLAADTTVVEFGPENISTIYMPRPHRSKS